MVAKTKTQMLQIFGTIHVKQLFITVEYKFPLPGHTFLPCDRDFGVIEKMKRKTAAVYNPECWFTIVDKAKVKNQFKVVRMTQKENFVGIAQ